MIQAEDKECAPLIISEFTLTHWKVHDCSFEWSRESADNGGYTYEEIGASMSLSGLY